MELGIGMRFDSLETGTDSLRRFLKMLLVMDMRILSI
jgi:hypothetical protein